MVMAMMSVLVMVLIVFIVAGCIVTRLTAFIMTMVVCMKTRSSHIYRNVPM